MRNITQAKARKEMNLLARENGLILRKQNATINGTQAYKLENRVTGELVRTNMTFWSAYEYLTIEM